MLCYIVTKMDDNNMFMFAVLGALIVLAIGVSPYLKQEPKLDGEYNELTPSQISKMVELGAIKIHLDLPHNTNDKPMKIVYEVRDRKCYLYQDILGRYYCRW